MSNFLVPHLEGLLETAQVVPMVNQIEFHPRLVQPELLHFCRQHQIQVEAWSPLLKGAAFDLPVIQQLAEKHRRTPAQVVLRWDLQHGVATIPKSVRREHIETNAEIFDFELSPEEMRDLDRLDQGQRTGPNPDTFF